MKCDTDCYCDKCGRGPVLWVGRRCYRMHDGISCMGVFRPKFKYACPRCGKTTIGTNRKAHPDPPSWGIPRGHCPGATECLQMPKDKYDAMMNVDRHEELRDKKEDWSVAMDKQRRENW